jgi:hypothetical protein
MVRYFIDTRGLDNMKNGGYENRTDKKDFTMMSTISIIVLLFAILGSSMSPVPIVICILGSILAFLIFFVGWEREYIIRPRSVEIAENEIIFNMRYGRGKKVVRYEEIKWISVDAATSINYGSKDPDGYIGLGNRMRDIHPVERWLALLIRDAYIKKIGRWPPQQNPDWI